MYRFKIQRQAAQIETLVAQAQSMREALEEIPEFVRSTIHLVKLDEFCSCSYCNEGYWCQGAVDAVCASRNELVPRLQSLVDAALAQVSASPLPRPNEVSPAVQKAVARFEAQLAANRRASPKAEQPK